MTSIASPNIDCEDDDDDDSFELVEFFVFFLQPYILFNFCISLAENPSRWPIFALFCAGKSEERIFVIKSVQINRLVYNVR